MFVSFRATFDKSKTFYALEKEAGRMDCFFEVFDQDPNIQENDTKERSSLKTMKLVSASKNYSKSRLRYSPENFGKVLIL